MLCFWNLITQCVMPYNGNFCQIEWRAMSDKKVRIGFVGVGGMGQCAHLKNYVTVPECEVVAIAEVRPNLREAVAKKYGVARTYANADEMLAKEELDGLVE